MVIVFHSQLYGEEDPDQDVSPDTEDPEAAGDAGQRALGTDTANSEVCQHTYLFKIIKKNRLLC